MPQKPQQHDTGKNRNRHELVLYDGTPSLRGFTPPALTDVREALHKSGKQTADNMAEVPFPKGLSLHIDSNSASTEELTSLRSLLSELLDAPVAIGERIGDTTASAATEVRRQLTVVWITVKNAAGTPLSTFVGGAVLSWFIEKKLDRILEWAKTRAKERNQDVEFRVLLGPDGKVAKRFGVRRRPDSRLV